MNHLKHSRQRDAIKQNLSSRTDHPTADAVYMDVKKEFPNISLGTVYRNLTLLADIGEILRLRLGDGVDHFDGNAMPHHHFICNQCHSVIDLDIPPSDFAADYSQIPFDGIITGYSIHFEGLCSSCSKQK